MNKVYVNPSIKLINSRDNELGFFLWLKSRQAIVTDLDGNSLMTDLTLTPNWFDDLPESFYVGGELVNKEQYRSRIDLMNLQYNNGDYMLFEITGSCLFRDICFNINSATQWAESNRFLFSILDESERFNWEHYKISAEYKGIPEWESQFTRYMDSIRLDPIVDHNRHQMPYSISSRFWFGITRQNLIYFLGFLKYHMPFFWGIYGQELANLSNISDSQLSPELNPLVSQYILDMDDVTEEQVEELHGTVFVTTKMGLILYSQFLRQSNSTIQGLYNELIHDDPSQFEHKVFKGNSIFMIRYKADKAKVYRTVKNRLCAFAMSSGNDPCSWSYFLNNFIPKVMDPETLMKLLPCTFVNGKLTNCKFYDDIKFRNEGKEISNCPCPLVTLNPKDALEKLNRDNNRIGSAFNDLTTYLRQGGFNCYFNNEVWTSELKVYTDFQLGLSVHEELSKVIKSIEYTYSKFNKSNLDLTNDHELKCYVEYALGNDYTCMLKGRLIDQLAVILNNHGHTRYLINFGGDIYAHNCSADVHIDGTKFNISKHGTFSIFTSGNVEKRGNHIIGGNTGSQVTTIVDWDGVDFSLHNNTLVDILSTKLVANEVDAVQNIINILQMNGAIIDHLHFEYGKLLNNTYCASPFFDPSQISIRDQMISEFVNVFRPDLTDSEYKYNGDHMDDDMVSKVVQDNVNGIYGSELLVFPNRTTDLGTLFEVGVALASHIPIIKYDEDKQVYTLIFPKCDWSNVSRDKTYLFECSKKSEVIAMGAISTMVNPRNIYYTLKGASDNIMLSVNYNHVEYDGVEYKLIKRDRHERDK